jgi:ketosteroid isomerase-like protein
MFSSLRGLFVLLALGSAANAADTSANLAEQVRATEIAFAKTLADRDVAKFASMIAPDTIWLADKPLHGPDEVLASWRKFFEGPKAPFSWHPEIVEVQAGGMLALSTGPVFNPEGKRVATYTSIWRREANGEWKIIFDRGCPVCGCDPPK